MTVVSHCTLMKFQNVSHVRFIIYYSWTYVRLFPALSVGIFSRANDSNYVSSTRQTTGLDRSTVVNRRCRDRRPTIFRQGGAFSGRRVLDQHVEERNDDNTETDDIFCILCGRCDTVTHLPSYPSCHCNARTDAGDRNPTFAIFLKAHSDGLWLTRSHFHKLVLFRFAFPRRLFPPETSFLRGPFLTNRTNHGPKDGAYLTITITV